MGNCVSASTAMAPKIRVVQASEGRIVDVEVPSLQASMTVGELLLEFPPAHFVAQLNAADFLASTGKRPAPLGADADAKPGVVYVLFPMPRLHTRITPQELRSFAKLLHLHDQQLTRAHSPKVHGHGLFTAGARVAPLAEEVCKHANGHSGDVADEQASASGKSLNISMHEQCEEEACASSLYSSHIGVITKPKPWAPKLQTIMESCS